QKISVILRELIMAGDLVKFMLRNDLNILNLPLFYSKKYLFLSRTHVILGLAYKPDVDDMRESPSLAIMDLLKEYNADISYYDPHIPVIPPTRDYLHWEGMHTVAWEEPVIRSFDAVIISTNHSSVDYNQLANWCDCIIDTRNAMNGVEQKPGQVWKA
ncbi:MAG: UDP binding domain-containing protein, partial [Balneolaceae bacterium]|nr:UDP binding domain-containing protein [Balneolaceae bacterium]